MKTSRQRLLDYIQAHRAVTTEEISRALRMTRANARHHLSILQDQGLVAVVGHRTSGGKGRPAAVYGLSQQAQGDSLKALCGTLLDDLAGALPESGKREAMQRVARRLAGRVSQPEKGKSGASLSRRLMIAVERLNELNYQARWEAHATAPRLILGRCPYAAILPEHPELCQLDASLLEALTGVSVEQKARLEPDLQGLPHCVFALKTRYEKSQ